MIPILTPKEMYSLDSYLISNVGNESKLLMENAAVYTSHKIREILPIKSKILILCGVGNNGGDGLALVRHLANYYAVSYVLIGDRVKQTIDNKYNYEILQKLNLVEVQFEDLNLNNFDCIIDAIFGIGGKSPLSEEVAEIIYKINETDCTKIAIDIPTGLDGETGIAYTTTFKADYTYTMYAEKNGLLLNDGKDYSGKVEVLNLGIPQRLINPYASIYKYNNILSLQRKHNTSKFDYGKCLVLAGSENMSGAAALTCNAAISTGAGLVYLITTNKHNSLYPEIIAYTVDEYNPNILNNSDIRKLLDNSNSIVIGPGIGKSNEISKLIVSIIDSYPNKKFIIDADGISALEYNSVYSKNITITPHIGEFANLIGKDRLEITDKLIILVKETASKMNINILLKGTTTIISDGEDVILVSDGIPEMATAGSGDVLSGILGAQVNHNLFSNFIELIANAALTHINAAKNALNNNHSLIASDIIKGLKCIK